MGVWHHGRLGFVLASEEHSATHLVELGRLAEDTGFGFLFLSDHFHPWNLAQGHSSNIWPVLGALAQQTSKIALVSAVTSPILRIHPTTLAQAASTVSNLSAGRFILGLGTGEALNEEVVGEGFPPFPERLSRLKESVEMLRELLSGAEVTVEGRYFKIERATLFDAVPELPVYLAASGPKSADLVSDFGDGLICLGCRPELARSVCQSKPRVTQVSVCWDTDLERAKYNAHRYFPEVALPGTTFARLSTPAEFSEATRSVSRDDVAAAVVCGPDPESYKREIQQCLDAGFDAVALHQIGPEQAGFLEFCARELL